MKTKKGTPMGLAVGTVAPRFELPAKPGDVVNVGALFGSEKVVLLFFPLAFSSVCTEEMCHFRDSWAEWSALGCKVFGVSIDSPFVVDKFRAELNVPFPILSDFNKTVAASYDALHADLMGLKGVTKRAAYVIGSDGKIAYAWEAEIPKTQVDFAAIKAAVAAAK
ncbi:MAG: peroxiredoxin [Limnohabitans sp.]|nr:peroxiredoxin [Limnohabitans sp.]